jgi:hypothetical protein
MNLELKAELVKRYGSQVKAAKALGLSESRLSYLVQGHIEASSVMRSKFESTFGPGIARKLLPRSVKTTPFRKGKRP